MSIISEKTGSDSWARLTRVAGVTGLITASYAFSCCDRAACHSTGLKQTLRDLGY